MIAYYLQDHQPAALDRAAAVVDALPPGTTVVSPRLRPLGWTTPWSTVADDSPDVLAAWIASTGPEALVVDGTTEHVRVATGGGRRVAVVALPGGGESGALGSAYGMADVIVAPWAADALDSAWPTAWEQRTIYLGAVGAAATRGLAGRTAPVVRGERGPWRCLSVAPKAAGPGPRERREMIAATAAWTWWFAGERELFGHGPIWESLARCDVLVGAALPGNLAAAAAAQVPAVLVLPEHPPAAQQFLAEAARRSAPVVLTDRPTSALQWRDLLTRAHDLDGAGWDRWSPAPGLAELAGALGAAPLATTEPQAPALSG